MYCGSNFSLSGKSNYRSNNLTGKKNNHIASKNTDNTSEPPELYKIKMKIMATILFPIISQQWAAVMENRFIISIIKEQLERMYDKYYKIYYFNNPTHVIFKDIAFYRDVITMAEAIILEHNDVTDLEKKLYGKRNDVGTIVFRTKMIKLKPEFEVYNLIIGRPDKGVNYDDDTLQYIQQLIRCENMTFDKIKTQLNEHVLEKKN